MKKYLLLSLTALAAGSALAANEVPSQLVPDFLVTHVSPEGRFIGGGMYGVITVRDLQNNQDFVIGNGMDEYTLGLGNAFSATGVAVGSMGDVAAIWNGNGDEMVPLMNDDTYPLSYANAITADGSRIAGSVWNVNNEGGYEGTMLVPAYWDVNADGTVGELHILPFPAIDFTDRAPSYVTATAISADGTVIAGQVLDYSGRTAYPIIYTQQSDGEWVYTLPASDLLNPSHLVLPEEPGDYPVMPDVTSFMSEENAAAYEAALEEWMANGYDPDTYPEAGDYMTPEEVEAYNEAVDVYNAAAIIFNEKLEAYYTVLDEIFSESVLFDFNATYLSSNGRYFLTGATRPSEERFGSDTRYVINFDLADNTRAASADSLNLTPTMVLADGTILCATMSSMTGPGTSYIKTAGSENYVLLYDWMQADKPVWAEWADNNLRHPYEVFDMETFEPSVVDDYLFIGRVYSTDDLGLMAGVVESYMWLDNEGEEPAEYTTYVLGGDGQSSIAGISAALDLTVSARRGGELTLGAKVDTLAVYDLSGRQVYAAGNAEGTLRTGLANGVYVVKATAGDRTATFKVVF